MFYFDWPSLLQKINQLKTFQAKSSLQNFFKKGVCSAQPSTIPNHLVTISYVKGALQASLWRVFDIQFFRLFYYKLDIFEVILLVIIVRYLSRDTLKAKSL